MSALCSSFVVFFCLGKLPHGNRQCLGSSEITLVAQQSLAECNTDASFTRRAGWCGDGRIPRASGLLLPRREKAHLGHMGQ